MAERRPLTPDETRGLFQLLTSARIIANALAQFEWDAVEPLVRLRRPIDPMALARLESPKLEEWRRVAEELLESDGKVVVFSQWERMLHLAELSVRDLLEQRGFEALCFAGSVPVKVRAGTVERFHSDPRVRLLFSTDAGGVGLNLQEASSTVVHLDMPWNPAVLAQRVGRVHRMGQRRGVRVLHFISERSIEERVFEAARAKRALFDSLLGDGDGIVFDDASRRTFVERVRCLIAPPAAAVMAPAAIPAELPESEATLAAQAQTTPEHSEPSTSPGAMASPVDGTEFVMSVDPATGAVTVRAGSATALLAALQALSAQGPSPTREAAPPAHRALPLLGDPSRRRLEASARLAQLDPLAERGHERLAEGDLAAAVRIFETVLSRSEEHLESWLGLADAAHASRDLERAVKAYGRARALGRAALPTGFAGQLPWEAFGNRPFLRALAGLASTLAETGEGRAAEEARRELLALEPDAPMDSLMPPPQATASAGVPQHRFPRPGAGPRTRSST